MQIHIHSRDFDVTRAIGNRVRQQLGRGLQRFEGEMSAIDVYFSDINGPRGGADKRVLMRASLHGLPPVSTAVRHADLYVAIGRSAKRLRRAVKRSLTKRRSVEPRTLLRLRRLAGT